MNIDIELVKNLIQTQFPEFSHLCIKPVVESGWDNRTFHLGEELLVRLPSDSKYAAQVNKEQCWLPFLANYLPCKIPEPIRFGNSSERFPHPWSIYRWIEGEAATLSTISDIIQFSQSLADFLIDLHKISTLDGPVAGPENFHRGGNLAVYNEQTLEALNKLSSHPNCSVFRSIWQQALQSKWNGSNVWVHGDLSPNNILIKNGELEAIIDFGQLAVGDPACDLVITWTFLPKEARSTFKNALTLDDATWQRAKGWALWKALIICAELPGTNANLINASQQILRDLVNDQL